MKKQQLKFDRPLTRSFEFCLFWSLTNRLGVSRAIKTEIVRKEKCLCVSVRRCRKFHKIMIISIKSEEKKLFKFQ